MDIRFWYLDVGYCIWVFVCIFGLWVGYLVFGRMGCGYLDFKLWAWAVLF